MITGRQVRAARALLNWKQEMLAENALVALTALKRLESERGLRLHGSNRNQIRRALEAAGILFVESDRGRNVTLLNESMDSASMQTPPLDPPVADIAPTDRVLTGYDEQHVVTYLRLLDAEHDGADWQAVAKVVLHIDPDSEPLRARRAWETHLARARWMTENGYRHLVRGGAPH